MRRILFGLACALVGACSSSMVPTAPSVTQAAPEVVTPPVITAQIVPMHHNIPATMEDGSIVWLCATQPRNYIDAQGRTTLEEDHYIQRTQCPDQPIK